MNFGLSILGDSHAPHIFRQAAGKKGFVFCSPELAQLVIIAQDTPTKNGIRDLEPIYKMTRHALANYKGTILLTSQVPPGFTRAFNAERLYHQSETLRIKDALERALYPEQIILGCMYPERPLPEALFGYATAFNCPIRRISYEAAEFSKIAINITLASQVNNTNRLSTAAAKLGIEWHDIQTILKADKRIGPHSYLEPGNWMDSEHLKRDAITMVDL